MRGNIALNEKTVKVRDGRIPGNSESDSSAIFEANDECSPAEADFSHVRAELEGHWQGYEAVTRTPRASLRAR